MAEMYFFLCDLNSIPEALQMERKALMVAMSQNNLELVQAIRGHLDFIRKINAGDFQ